VRGAERCDRVQSNGVVPTDDRVVAELSHIPREVIDERVVVVDE
jgi:hypothetical protein